MGEIDESSGVFDTERHSNVKTKPEYRRVRKYYKSPGRWRLERDRRKRVLELWEEGLSYGEIAGRLEVSKRTVKRDMAKIRPYYERKVKSLLRKLQEQRIADLKGELEGKSLVQRMKILERRMEDYSRQLKQRRYRRGRFTVTINLDAVVVGKPVLEYAPSPPFSAKFPLEINFELVLKGEKTFIGSLSLS